MTSPAETNPAAATRTVVIERHFPHPPEKLWRALTESSLLAQWLMNNDFAPVVGRKFQLRHDPMPHWNGIIDGEVLTIVPLKQLSYTWSSMGLDTVVRFTLTPSDGGTHLRVEQSGFPTDQDTAYKGATYGWQNFLAALDRLLGGLQ